jgi:hypothetical protein
MENIPQYHYHNGKYSYICTLEDFIMEKIALSRYE